MNFDLTQTFFCHNFLKDEEESFFELLDTDSIFSSWGNFLGEENEEEKTVNEEERAPPENRQTPKEECNLM